MKRIGEYFAGAYKNAFARWIFGITASLVILPDLIKTVLLCIKKESLAAGTVFIATCYALYVHSFSHFLQFAQSEKRQRRLSQYGLRAVFPV